jgi:ribosomal protein S27E
MNVKIISDLSGELQFDMSAENLVQLIGAATRYAADNPAKVSAVYDAARDAVQEYAKQPEVKPEKPMSRNERMFGNYHSRIPIASVVPPMPAVQNPKQEESYKGFLLIQCEDCGKIRGFYARQPQTKFYCDCGNETDLSGLRPLFLHCKKCGDSFKYMTNATDEHLTYECLHCGSPADLELNKRGDAYVTVSDRRF